jgi:hypothetical protein
VSDSLGSQWQHLDDDEEDTAETCAAWPELERLLVIWQHHVESQGGFTNGPLLQEKARLLWQQIPQYSSEKEPQFTTGWLTRFKFFMGHTLYDTFREAYNTENSRLEKEQLQEVATTGRVEVPVMDFTVPNPPWNVSKLSGFKKPISQPREVLKSIMKEIEILDPPKALPKLNHTVDWTVFPASLAEVALVEEFGNEDVLMKYINSAMDTGVTNRESLTYKAPGIRILREDDDDDDEDLEPGVFFHQELDMASLIKKRKLELGEMEEHGTQENIQGSEIPTTHTTTKKHFRKPTPGIIADFDTVNEGHGNGGYGETLIGGIFSATTALDNFMEMRGTKRHKPTDSTSSYFSTPKAAPIDNPTPPPIPPPIANSRLTKADIPLPLSNITGNTWCCIS